MRTDHILTLNNHLGTTTLPAIDTAIAECRNELVRLMAFREVIGMALGSEKIEQPGADAPSGAGILKLAMERAAAHVEAAE